MVQASNISEVQMVLPLTGKEVAQLEFLSEKISPQHLAHSCIKFHGD